MSSMMAGKKCESVGDVCIVSILTNLTDIRHLDNGLSLCQHVCCSFLVRPYCRRGYSSSRRQEVVYFKLQTQPHSYAPKSSFLADLERKESTVDRSRKGRRARRQKPSRTGKNKLHDPNAKERVLLDTTIVPRGARRICLLENDVP